MGLRKPPLLHSEMYPPTRQDRLFVLLVTVGTSLLLLLLARNIQPQAIGWIVMVVVLGLPVVAINVLFSFSRWEQSSSEEESKRLLTHCR
jgi:hypothetical protein